MDLSRYVDADLASAESITWSTDAHHLEHLLVVAGLLAQTNERLLFLPKRRPSVLSSRRWSLHSTAITTVETLSRWNLPLTGMLTADRIQVRHSGGVAAFRVHDPHDALIALRRPIAR